MAKKTTPTPAKAAKRQRNPVATRKAILESARMAFTKCGYDRAGVRGIAENAGVTAMLVKHYFGSKEQLFEEVVEETLAVHGLMHSKMEGPARDSEALGREIAEELVASSNSGVTPDGTVILLRSVGNDQAARILRDKAVRYLEPVTKMLPGDSPDIQAALCIALISGYKLMRQVVALPALAEGDTDEITRFLSKLFAELTAGKKQDDSATPEPGPTD